MNAVEKFFKSYGVNTTSECGKWDKDYEHIALEAFQESDPEKAKQTALEMFFDVFSTLRVENLEKLYQKEIQSTTRMKNKALQIYSTYYIDVMIDEKWDKTDLVVLFNPDYYYKNDIHELLQNQPIVELLGKELSIKSMFGDEAQQIEVAAAIIRKQIDFNLRNKGMLEQMKSEFPDVLWNYLKRNKKKINA